MGAADTVRWQTCRRRTGWLLLVWCLATFGTIYFARDLDGVVFGGPIGFWAASQGALLVYLGLVCLYAWLMRRVDAAEATVTTGDGADGG